MAGKFCDVCGKDDIGIAGVVSSQLGPMSFAYCPLCLIMGAEPKFMMDSAIESCGGIDNVHKGLLLTYYDMETDSYIDKREGAIPIQLIDGREFKMRSEFVAYEHLAINKEEK